MSAKSAKSANRLNCTRLSILRTLAKVDPGFFWAHTPQMGETFAKVEVDDTPQESVPHKEGREVARRKRGKASLIRLVSHLTEGYFILYKVGSIPPVIGESPTPKEGWTTPITPRKRGGWQVRIVAPSVVGDVLPLLDRCRQWGVRASLYKGMVDVPLAREGNDQLYPPVDGPYKRVWKTTWKVGHPDGYTPIEGDDTPREYEEPKNPPEEVWDITRGEGARVTPANEGWLNRLFGWHS